MNKHLERAEKIVTRIKELASISEDDGSITRRYGTAASVRAGKKVLDWMRMAGLRARIDAIGNIRGIWPSEQANAKTLVIGSHIDTVVDAGAWDGPLGVLTGLDILENIIRRGEQLPFHVELIAFCDEEGVRFHTTYLGSKVVAGTFDKEMLTRKDGEGVSLKEAISVGGGDAGNLDKESLMTDRWLGYFEIHIEQGPILYDRKIPVAPVKAIAGQVRVEVVFKGEAGHAGTVPMDTRHDALCGAAEFILAAEALASVGMSGLLATVGRLQITGAASNVIPGEVTCTVDIRSADMQVLSRGHEKLWALCETIAGGRGLTFSWKVVQTSPAIACDVRMNELLGRSVANAGYEVLELVSGAGHDAVPISAVSPVCMLFVRCYKGISHNPLEDVETSDLEAAIVVADDFLHQLSEIWKYPL